MNIRSLFLHHVAQTSPEPVGLSIVAAEGSYLIDDEGTRYLDIIGGISVCNVGHRNPRVVEAIRQQADRYLHIMVYGELIQSPQVQYARLITRHLPEHLDCVYFTNSGAEATEAALKLARRVTGRPGIIAANKSYHGHTMGALSIMGDEYWRNAFRPLVPGTWHYDYNSEEMIAAIDHDTACVVLETIQSEAGIIEPDRPWLEKIRAKCDETGALLIFDEIQCGFGRTGKLWGFEHYGIVPDLLLLGKALGGGMPMGAVVASHDNLNAFTNNPVLGHMTTFGGHPVCCAAGMAAMEFLLDEKLTEQVKDKELLFRQLLQHEKIQAIRSKGLFMAVELADNTSIIRTLKYCLEDGLFSDWFLFAANCIRVAPPLTITPEEIEIACGKLCRALDKL